MRKLSIVFTTLLALATPAKAEHTLQEFMTEDPIYQMDLLTRFSNALAINGQGDYWPIFFMGCFKGLQKTPYWTKPVTEVAVACIMADRFARAHPEAVPH